MQQDIIHITGPWGELEREVTAQVGTVLHKSATSRSDLITYLRDLEVIARTECDRRQTIQIITSGRRLLGDRTILGPHDGLFTRSVT